MSFNYSDDTDLLVEVSPIQPSVRHMVGEPDCLAGSTGLLLVVTTTIRAMTRAALTETKY